jgi:hypothetical protein
LHSQREFPPYVAYVAPANHPLPRPFLFLLSIGWTIRLCVEIKRARSARIENSNENHGSKSRRARRSEIKIALDVAHPRARPRACPRAEMTMTRRVDMEDRRCMRTHMYVCVCVTSVPLRYKLRHLPNDKLTVTAREAVPHSWIESFPVAARVCLPPVVLPSHYFPVDDPASTQSSTPSSSLPFGDRTKARTRARVTLTLVTSRSPNFVNR